MSQRNEPVNCGCGGEAKVYDCDKYDSFSMLYWVSCEKCDITTDSYDSEEEAIDAWNKAMGERTAKVHFISTKMGFSIRCGQCNRPVCAEESYCPYCGARLEWNEART